jgi:hypothetical protein
MEQRKDQRVNKRLVASYGHGGFEAMGITSNISSRGLCILSHTLAFRQPEKRRILVNLGIFDELYELNCQVKWSRVSSGVNGGDFPVIMGVQILQAPDGYLNYVKYFSYQPQFESF